MPHVPDPILDAHDEVKTTLAELLVPILRQHSWPRPKVVSVNIVECCVLADGEERASTELVAACLGLEMGRNGGVKLPLAEIAERCRNVAHRCVGEVLAWSSASKRLNAAYVRLMPKAAQ